MSLWIRSQDRKHFDEIHGVSIGGTNNNIITSEKIGVLGRYETEERAMEILDEIQSMLIIRFNKNGNHDELDVYLKSMILDNMRKVYIMPQE